MSTEGKVDEKTKPVTEPQEEDDLDDLDDLLDDFAGEVLSKPPGSTIPGSVKNDESGSTTTAGPNAIPGSVGAGGPNETSKAPQNAQPEPINDEYKDKLEDLIKDLNIQDPETKEQFEQLVKNFEEENDDAPKDPKNFDNIMKDTMERLKNSGKNIDEQIKNDQSSGNPEDMLSQLLAGLGGAGGMPGGNGGDMDMSKLLVDMLEQLSSKEVLYEPIKDLNTKFPDYLKEKKDSLPADQYENFTKQYDLTNDIVAVFEAEGYNDDDKEQRDKVNSLLESLQELGQPPTDLVGEAGDFPGFGGGGNGLGFSDKDLPKDFEKELDEGCNQQ